MRQHVLARAPALERGEQIAQRAARLGLELIAVDHGARRRGERDTPLARMRVQDLDRGFSQTALGHVHDALECEVVAGGMDDAKISERIADLLALVETRAAKHPVGQAQGDEAILELAHLKRGAHQNGDLVQGMRHAGAVVARKRLDLLPDHARLLFRIPTRGHLHLVSRLVLGAQRLAKSALVVSNKMGSRRENVSGRAVVAFQPNDLGAGKVVLEAQDIVDFGAAPAIDGLVVIPDAADVLQRADGCLRREGGVLLLVLPLPACGERVGVRGTTRALPQQSQPEILGDVGVLILVHQNVSKPPLILAQHLRLLAKKPDAPQQQVAEVGRVEHLEPILVGGIEFLALAGNEARGFSHGDLLRDEPPVLPSVDQARQHARRPAFLVDVLGFEQLPEQADLIVGIENREVGLESDELGVPAHNFRADGMKCAEPRHSLDDLPHHGADAGLHLARSLVGESHRENVAGPRTSGGQDVRYPCREDARFPGSGTGQNEHRPVERLDRKTLLWIEVVEIRRAGGRARPRRDPAGLWRRCWGADIAGMGHSRSMIGMHRIARAELNLTLERIPIGLNRNAL